GGRFLGDEGQAGECQGRGETIDDVAEGAIEAGVSVVAGRRGGGFFRLVRLNFSPRGLGVARRRNPPWFARLVENVLHLDL
ncbi:hypothetical protein CH063_12714, partial [Colletotrichum higginsianum]